MGQVIQSARDGNVAILTINNPPVNALSTTVAMALAQAVTEAASDPSIEAIVLQGANGLFMAGADIREIAGIAAGQAGPLNLYSPLEQIENSPKPVIAAIEKQVLGGGLEAALACHYRVATAGAQIGFPEVKLGLIPGAGGTQRLPRLTGAAEAARLCVSGLPVLAEEAQRLGIIDAVVHGGDLLDAAIAFARDAAGKPIVKTRDRQMPDSGPMPEVPVTRGSAAPQLVVDAIRASMDLPFAAGCEREAQLFSQLLHAAESKALIHGFFGERTVAKVGNLPPSLPVKTVGVVGAGTMGSGIAITFASAGFPVLLKDASLPALERGMARVRKEYERAVAKGRLTVEAAERALALITPQITWDGFEQCDCIVEAVFENAAVKREVFAQLASVARPDCLLASNTSSLDIEAMASVTKQPEMVAGLHFFSPANVMKLLEVVRGKATSDVAIATAMGLGKRLGKVAVLARNSPGFIGNRVFAPYLRQARFLIEEGASVEQVNGALYEWGMAMGPLAVDDLTGLDVSFHIEEQLSKPGVRRPFVTGLLYRAGRLGQKSGKGWLRYDEMRRASQDPELAPLIAAAAREAGVEQRPVANQEIVERCLLAMINEGARVLDEGVALRPVDIDIVFLKGFGFPAWRGGPMFYADTIGIAAVVAGIGKYGWEPAPLLTKLLAEQRSLASLNA